VRTGVWSVAVLLLFSEVCPADWTTVRGDAARTGRLEAEIAPSYRLAWARYFVGERLGSAMEPIVADGRLLVGTHQGNLYALDAASGKPVWRYPAPGAFLHAPACADGLVLAGDAAGYLHAVDAKSGTARWAIFASPGGFAASPTVADGAVFLGSRSGEFLAIELADGKVRWRVKMPAPIRQTAAFHDGRIFIAAEDLRVRSLQSRTGEVLWTSDPLYGQTARDGYPVVVRSGQRGLVVVRTNPVVNMAQRIAQDRRLLCQSAGVDDSDWRKLDAWTKSDRALGTPELWRKEQAAIVRYLQEHPEARSFFVLDAQTGKEGPLAPVLWCAGCQAIGTPPVVMPDGRLLVFYRSAYGNWNHGVAPLVALGVLDLADNRITPLQHASGKQPPWNTFWGTADESQNFVVAGNTLLIVHQSTLSALDLATRKLRPIWGERDSWGGFRNLPWARNEWNGPGRGGVAVVTQGPKGTVPFSLRENRDSFHRLYWQTGSRLLCLVPGQKAPGVKDEGIDGTQVPVGSSGVGSRGTVPFSLHENRDSPRRDVRVSKGTVPLSLRESRDSPQRQNRDNPPAKLDADELHERLRVAVEEVLSRPWTPLYVEPGLAGREFFFGQSGDVLAALARACPHLPESLQERVKAFLDQQWRAHPPLAAAAQYPLDQGERREWYRVPKELSTRLGNSRAGHPFGNVYAVWLYAERCGEWERVREAWPQLKAAFEDFSRTRWRLDPARGDLLANRYLASLLAFARIAQRMGEKEAAQQSERQAEETTQAVIAWWQRSAARMTLPVVPSIKEWDEFIGTGDALFFRVVPHRAKVALMHDLAPEVAARVKAKAPAAVKKVWRTFDRLCPTWHLVGEERQVHYGENFVDPPDLALDAFSGLAWLTGAPAADLAKRVDVPFCRADLSYLAKLAIALDRAEPRPQASRNP